MTQIASKPDYEDTIIQDGKASNRFQVFMDDIELRFNDFLLGQAVRIPIYAKASLPSASANFKTDQFSSFIFVKDETGGAVPCFTDGSAWRRVTDRAVVS